SPRRGGHIPRSPCDRSRPSGRSPDRSPHRHTSGAELLESSASAISRRASDLPLRGPQKEDLAPFRLPTTPPVSPYQQGGRLRSDWVAAFDRNRWPPSVGIAGRFASDSAASLRERISSFHGGLCQGQWVQ